MASVLLSTRERREAHRSGSTLVRFGAILAEDRPRLVAGGRGGGGKRWRGWPVPKSSVRMRGSEPELNGSPRIPGRPRRRVSDVRDKSHEPCPSTRETRRPPTPHQSRCMTRQRPAPQSGPRNAAEITQLRIPSDDHRSGGLIATENISITGSATRKPTTAALN